MKKILALALCALGLCGVLAACGKSTGAPAARRQISSDEVQFAAPAQGASIAVVSTSMGDFSILLYPQYAPMAVENFTALAARGYYNGVVFHRVIADFAVQTGDAGGTGTGGASIWNNHAYPTELSDQLHHYAGAVALARAADGSVGNLSQFYIVQAPQNSVDKAAAQKLLDAGVRKSVADTYRAAGGAPYLDGRDTVFGQVYSGMEVIDAIAGAKCDANSRPLEDITVNSITVTAYAAADSGSQAAS